MRMLKTTIHGACDIFNVHAHNAQLLIHVPASG
jgi:hypothetical protein